MVGFRVFGTEQISYAKWELDMEGDNKFEIAEYGTPVAQVTYYAPGAYFPRFLFYDNRGQVIAYAQGRVDVQGQPGIAMGELANPLPLVPKIEYFNGPTSVRAGENLTLTWKVLNATCGVRLDGKEVNPTDSYTYTVPMQKAPYTIRHLLMVYGEPCDKPVPYGKYLDVPFLEREPNAPKEFKFTGWTEKGDWPVANFEWKDNSYNEDGFWVYRGEEYVGSRPANNTTISILPEISCGASFTYYVTAYNGMGKSAPSNFVTVEDICPPTKRILDFSVGPGQSGIEYIFNVFCPGIISARANWTGTASDLDLTLEGPRNYGWHAEGPSPMALSANISLSNLSRGYGYKVFVQNNYGGSAKGTIALTYPEGCF